MVGTTAQERKRTPPEGKRWSREHQPEKAHRLGRYSQIVELEHAIVAKTKSESTKADEAIRLLKQWQDLAKEKQVLLAKRKPSGRAARRIASPVQEAMIVNDPSPAPFSLSAPVLDGDIEVES